jgi:predicted dehydrogenase
MKRKLRFGMVGGGRGAFIGAVHRLAATMDGKAELVAGAFSSDPKRSHLSGADLLLDPNRVYESYSQMARSEAARPIGQRLDFVVIVTPNDQHYPIARMFLEAGFNVVCDKPVTVNLAQAKALRAVVARSKKVFVLTHNYAGSAMVKVARELVRTGRLGVVRKVIVEYYQGWLADCVEASGRKQAMWRTDPARGGIGGCVSDIGTHAEHLARYVTGLELAAVCAELTTFVPRRQVNDDCTVLLRYQGGAKGLLHASQIAVGEDNALTLRVYGTKGALEWQQEYPEELVLKYPDRPKEILRRGAVYSEGVGKSLARIPAGHPEGYLEAFANVYHEALNAIAAEVTGKPSPRDLDIATIHDGVKGMAFIEATLTSAKTGKWVSLKR